jgi:hypothetical protein
MKAVKLAYMHTLGAVHFACGTPLLGANHWFAQGDFDSGIDLVVASTNQADLAFAKRHAILGIHLREFRTLLLSNYYVFLSRS